HQADLRLHPRHAAGDQQPVRRRPPGRLHQAGPRDRREDGGRGHQGHGGSLLMVRMSDLVRGITREAPPKPAAPATPPPAPPAPPESRPAEPPPAPAKPAPPAPRSRTSYGGLPSDPPPAPAAAAEPARPETPAEDPQKLFGELQ